MYFNKRNTIVDDCSLYLSEIEIKVFSHYYFLAFENKELESKYYLPAELVCRGDWIGADAVLLPIKCGLTLLRGGVQGIVGIGLPRQLDVPLLIESIKGEKKKRNLNSIISCGVYFV